MNFQQREGARLVVGGTKDKTICQRLGINKSTWLRWRHDPEFAQYTQTLETEREKEAVERGLNRGSNTIEVPMQSGLSVTAEIAQMCREAVETLKDLIHDPNPRVSLSASIQVLALAGHVPPARTATVKPNDAASRRGSALARLSAAVDDDEGVMVNPAVASTGEAEGKLP